MVDFKRLSTPVGLVRRPTLFPSSNLKFSSRNTSTPVLTMTGELTGQQEEQPEIKNDNTIMNDKNLFMIMKLFLMNI